MMKPFVDGFISGLSFWIAVIIFSWIVGPQWFHTFTMCLLAATP